MRQGVGSRQEVRTQVNLRVDPRVLLSSQLLQFGQTELEAAIECELAENPALERLQDEPEPLTDESILKAVAPQELSPSSEDFEFRRSLPQGSVEEVDWTDLAAGSESLLDHLQAQLSNSLPSELWAVGEYLIGCLDDRGYLSTTIEEAALDCNCSLEDAEQALKALQACEPGGIGATSIKECLLLQLRNGNTLETKLARLILKNHFEDFLDRNIRPIMRRYRVMPEVVERAFEEIVRLTPYPGESFRNEGRQKSAQHAIVPDLVICLEEAGWRVDLKGANSQSLFISRTYRSRQEQLDQMANPPRDEKRHVAEYVERASRFIQAIEQRTKTLLRIGRYLIEQQNGFVATGEYNFLRPLTRTRLAKELELHESTVSRATQGKFVQLATGEIVSFEVFFKPALRIQRMIEEILGRENPENPLSDEQIAELLAKKGVNVARRTVNKYRDRNKQLSSRRRRSA